MGFPGLLFTFVVIRTTPVIQYCNYLLKPYKAMGYPTRFAVIKEERMLRSALTFVYMWIVV